MLGLNIWHIFLYLCSCNKSIKHEVVDVVKGIKKKGKRSWIKSHREKRKKCHNQIMLQEIQEYNKSIHEDWLNWSLSYFEQKFDPCNIFVNTRKLTFDWRNWVFVVRSSSLLSKRSSNISQYLQSNSFQSAVVLLFVCMFYVWVLLFILMSFSNFALFKFRKTTNYYSNTNYKTQSWKIDFQWRMFDRFHIYYCKACIV